MIDARRTHTGTIARTLPRAVVLMLAIVLAASGAASAGDETAAAAFERFKALEGEWIAAEDSQMTRKGELVSRYEVTAGGSAVVETLFPGGDYEMVTVYYREGDELVLEHYCVEGNQPRMRATDLDGPRLHFAFDGGGGIRDAGHDRHMHSAWIEFVGPDELRSEWTELAGGETVLVVPSHVVRKNS